VATRADRRRADRAVPKNRPAAAPRSRIAWNVADAFGDSTALLTTAAFILLAGAFLFFLARAIEARITWYLAVDQFGYLQFAHDLLHGKVFHDWEPAKLLRNLPKRTDMLAQTYVWDDGKMYCRYAPGFPMLIAGWLAIFGDDRVSFLNPTILLTLLAVAMACEWRLSGSIWRGLVVAVLIALCPTMMYWWSLTLTRDLSAHLFAFIGLYQLIPRPEQPLTLRRTVVAGIAVGFAASIRNDAILYLLPTSLLVAANWWGSRPPIPVLRKVGGGLIAGLVLGLLPTLSYNTLATGNPFEATQGMEIQEFLTGTPKPEAGPRKVGYPSLWRGGTGSQVQGGGLRLENFTRTAPLEWSFVFSAYGWVLIVLAGMGTIFALVRRPAIFLFAAPYVVTAFLFYSCWSRPDRRYIIGLFSMVPFLITEGVFGSVDLVRTIAQNRDESVARPIAAVLAVVGILLAVIPFPPPPPTADATYLSKGSLELFSRLLPLAMGLGAAAAAWAPKQAITSVLAPALAVVLVGFGIQRASATSLQRAPFQRPQATLARETLRQKLGPRAIVITSEDMGRPAENIEYYGGVPALYLTDLERWHIQPADASHWFIMAGVRPYLLVDKGVREYARTLAELAARGITVDRIVDVPAGKNMEYFVASPAQRNVKSELFRISAPALEDLMPKVGLAPPAG
jgi:hypothetical protein